MTNQLQEDIATLRELESAETPTVSMVVELGKERRQKLSTEINSLARELKDLLGRWEEDHHPSRPDRAILSETEQQARQMLEEAVEQKGAWGVALYLDVSAGVKMSIPLYSQQKSAVTLSRRPNLQPLIAELQATSGWAVLVLGRDRGSFYLGGPAHFWPVHSYKTSLRKETNRGDLNSAKNIGRIRQSATDNIRQQLLSVPEAQHYLLVVPSKLQGEIEELLPKNIANRVEKIIDNENSEMSADQVQELFTPFFVDFSKEHQEAVRQTIERVRRQGRSVSGADEVITAVNQRRVQTVVLPESWQQPGSWDPEGALISSLEEPGWQRRFDIVPELKIQVLRAGGEIVYLDDQSEPAAILYY